MEGNVYALEGWAMARVADAGAAISDHTRRIPSTIPVIWDECVRDGDKKWMPMGAVKLTSREDHLEAGEDPQRRTQSGLRETQNNAVSERRGDLWDCLRSSCRASVEAVADLGSKGKANGH